MPRVEVTRDGARDGRPPQPHTAPSKYRGHARRALDSMFRLGRSIALAQ
jgi:hypothetical protein